MRKLLYFGYFVKTTNYKTLADYMKNLKLIYQTSYIKIVFDVIVSSFRHMSSFEDYFMFKFFKKNKEERKAYITTGKIYEFHNKMNTKEYRDVFRKKNKFNIVFHEFIKRDYLYLNDNFKEVKKWIEKRDKFMAKPNEGSCGIGIKIIKTNDHDNLKELYNYLIGNGLNLIEELIVQNKKLEVLNSASVNTVRVFTVLEDEKVNFLGAILRMSKGSFIDNMSAGGIAAPIDLKTGKVIKAAVSKDPFEKEYKSHPITKQKIIGFKIPYWDEIVKMTKKAVQIVPYIRTVGWDMAVTDSGVELIEGNDNWGKECLQLTYQEGFEYMLAQVH